MHLPRFILHTLCQLFCRLLFWVLSLAFVLLAKAFGSVIPPLSGLTNIPVRTLVDSVIFTLAPLVYIPLSRSTFVLFDCVRLPDGDVVVEADNGTACFDSAWWSVFPLGFTCALLYIVGLPLYFGCTLFIRRHKLFDPQTTSRFGTLYRNWRRAYYWGEVANLGKRLTVVAAATFLSRHQVIQILIIVIVLGFSLGFVLKYQPYYVPAYNDVEVRLTACVVAIFLVGAGSYAERGSSSIDTFIFFATLTLVVALLVVSAHALVADVISIYHERNAGFIAASERQKRLVGVISNELADVEAGADVLKAAGDFLAVLDTASRGVESRHQRAGTISLGEMELEDL